MERVGILGGTFDPPHNGHLLLAQEVLTELSLDQIWFIPTNIPPHKQSSQTAAHKRLKMLELATKQNKHFVIDTIELDRGGPSYTVDTLQTLTTQYSDIAFYFLIGADMVQSLHTWERIEELLHMVTFVGVKRPGFSIETSYPIIELEIPQFDVSSSMLRERFNQGKNTKYFLAEDVRLYIEEQNLYG